MERLPFLLTSVTSWAWGLFPWWAQILIFIGVGLFLIGALMNFSTVVKTIAGWPGVAGFIIVASTVALVVWSWLTTKRTTKKAPASKAKAPKIHLPFD